MSDAVLSNTIKTTAPTLDSVIERPRLLNALTQLKAASKWLQAPSGTGKSTLAANYARSISKPFAWYRLDERDNDPAFFFDEFARAVGAQLALGESLPKFGSDDHDRQQEFAHRFAATLSAQLEEPALLVLDDVQRVTSDDMQVALAALITVAVNGSEVLFVSESTTPTAFFDAIAGRQLALLNDADLRFNGDECKTMTAALRVGDTHSESIAALTGGHAGALVLACELLRGSDPGSTLGVATAERIHLHLLTKLLDRMPPPRRELLMQTAFVGLVTRPIAEALAGSDAARELDPLVESGLLRRVGAEDSEMFEAHGLVRQGMQTLTRARLGQAAARALAERTATALIENGQIEAAFALLVDIASTARAISVMQQLAERYAAHGQIDLLMSSIAKLPPTDIDHNAWLCFWAGQALLRIDEERARVWFAKAYSAFEKSWDTFGMRLAAASVVTAFGLEWGDLRELDTWVDCHRSAGGDTPVVCNDRFEATLIMGVACAASVYGAYAPQIDADGLIARLQQLLELDQAWLSDDQRVQAARIVIDQGHVFLKHELAQAAIIATRWLIDRASGGALHRGRWLIAAASEYFESGDAPRSLAALNEAQLLVETSQSSRLSFELGLAYAGHWMKSQDLPQAAIALRGLEKLAGGAPPAQRAEHARLMTRLLMLQGHLADGLRWAQEARRLAIPAGFGGPSLRAFEIELVYALAANDQIGEAVALISEKDFQPREARLAIEYSLRFLLGAKSELSLLRIALGNAAQIGFVHLLDRARGPLAQICEAALVNGIETEFVHRIIETKKLAPPTFAGPHWPWPVKIRTLGGFRLEVRGHRYQPNHKAQEKPLELLKLLVTCQALGRDAADKTWICERLWPEAEHDKARKSLDMTVARLRRLLESDETIVLSEGRLQLSRSHVWTDIAPLRRALSHANVQRDARIAGKRTDEGGASIAAVLQHYSGPFFAEEEGPPWLLAGREAIMAAVRHALVSADALLDGSADESLIPALEIALAADPTSEDLARSLMRAHLRRGHHSEAIRVYRRLREMLSLMLSIAPSADAERLRDQAYALESQATQ
jgi:LuxR family maltose regulon positive regulatory protein